MDTLERELFLVAMKDRDDKIERLDRMVDLQDRLIALYEEKSATNHHTQVE